jgi:hypothetical protein
MAALPRKWVSGGAPTLPWQTSALQREAGFDIDDVAARVSFTVETTVLLSFALPHGDCSGVSIERRECASSSHGPFLRRSRLCIQQTAAAPPESWVKPEVDTPRV